MNPTERELWEKMVSSPFEPAAGSGAGIDVDAQLRIAHALEYIAAQIGPIRSKPRRALSDLELARRIAYSLVEAAESTDATPEDMELAKRIAHILQAAKP
jgi:hypothetical protein